MMGYIKRAVKGADARRCKDGRLIELKITEGASPRVDIIIPVDCEDYDNFIPVSKKKFYSDNEGSILYTCIKRNGDLFTDVYECEGEILYQNLESDIQTLYEERKDKKVQRVPLNISWSNFTKINFPKK